MILVYTHIVVTFLLAYLFVQLLGGLAHDIVYIHHRLLLIEENNGNSSYIHKELKQQYKHAPRRKTG